MLTSSLKNPLQRDRGRAGWKRYVWMRKNQICVVQVSVRACEISAVSSCSEASGWGLESVPVICDVPRQWNPSAGILTSASFAHSELERRGGSPFTHWFKLRVFIGE